MKIIGSFLIFWFSLFGFHQKSFCQQTKQDSLKTVFDNTKLPDTTRIKAGIQYLQPMLAQGDTSIGEYAKKMMILALRTEDKLLIGKSYNNLGMYYLFASEIEPAINNFSKAENQIRSLNKSHLFLATIYSSLGRLFSTNEQAEKSIGYYQQSIEILKQQDTTRFTLADWKDLNTGYFRAYYSMRSCYISLSNLEKANEMALTSEVYAKKLNTPMVYAALYSGWADLLVRLKKYEEAIRCAKLSIGYLEKINARANLSFVYGVLGNAYSEMGEHKQSIKYRRLALDIYEENNNAIKIANTYLGLSENYEAIGDKSEALKYLRLHVDLDDSLRNADRLAEMDELTVKYETEKKEAALKEMEQQNEITTLQSQRKTVLIYSILGGIVALLIISYFLFSRYRTKKQNELLKLELEEAEKLLNMEKKAAESELKALKSQMNPHFIFNALNSIQEQFMYGDKLKANEQLENFTYLTRQILNVSGKKLITIETEKEILTKYLELEKMRFQTSFNYSIKLNDSIDEDYLQIPPMLIQPFVENSIKHGLLHKEGEKKLSILFELIQNGEYVLCTVEDNGIGRERSAEIKARNENKHASFSTESIEQRLELLNTELKLKDLIKFEDLKDEKGLALGTRVEIKIPL